MDVHGTASVDRVGLGLTSKGVDRCPMHREGVGAGVLASGIPPGPTQRPLVWRTQYVGCFTGAIVNVLSKPPWGTQLASACPAAGMRGRGQEAEGGFQMRLLK